MYLGTYPGPLLLYTPDYSASREIRLVRLDLTDKAVQGVYKKAWTWVVVSEQHPASFRQPLTYLPKDFFIPLNLLDERAFPAPFPNPLRYFTQILNLALRSF